MQAGGVPFSNSKLDVADLKTEHQLMSWGGGNAYLPAYFEFLFTC